MLHRIWHCVCSVPWVVGLPEEGASVFYPLHCGALFIYCTSCSTYLSVPGADGIHC